MLELRPGCECCDRDLPPDAADALICTFECTWCADCSEVCLGGRCPNCGGDVRPRPVRPPGHLADHPASARRVHQPGLHRPVDLRVCAPVDDAALSGLHAAAFGGEPAPTPWSERLARHSLFWITAHRDADLVGFVNVVGDGGAHAVVLDTCVAPELQGHGIGRRLVARAADEARERGCEWLHADYEPGLVAFYERSCGLTPTAAGLLRLRR